MSSVKIRTLNKKKRMLLGEAPRRRSHDDAGAGTDLECDSENASTHREMTTPKPPILLMDVQPSDSEYVLQLVRHASSTQDRSIYLVKASSHDVLTAALLRASIFNESLSRSPRLILLSPDYEDIPMSYYGHNMSLTELLRFFVCATRLQVPCIDADACMTNGVELALDDCVIDKENNPRYFVSALVKPKSKEESLLKSRLSKNKKQHISSAVGSSAGSTVSPKNGTKHPNQIAFKNNSKRGGASSPATGDSIDNLYLKPDALLAPAEAHLLELLCATFDIDFTSLVDDPSLLKKYKNVYIIAAKMEDSKTWQHELLHAHYYFDAQYRKLAKETWEEMSPTLRAIVSSYFTSSGYPFDLFIDEFQAHIVCGDKIAIAMNSFDPYRITLLDYLEKEKFILELGDTSTV